MIKDKASISEKYDPALKMECQHEADKYFEECVEHQLRLCPAMGRLAAVEQEVHNIHAYAENFEEDVRKRAKRLYGTEAFCQRQRRQAVERLNQPETRRST